MIKNSIILVLICLYACGMGERALLKDYQKPTRADLEQFYWIPDGKCFFYSQRCIKRKRSGKCNKWHKIDVMKPIKVPEPLCSELRAANMILIKKSLVFGK